MTIARWELETPVKKAGGYEDDEPGPGGQPVDWQAWVAFRKHSKLISLQLQFSSAGVDRREAEKIVQSALAGLNDRHGLTA